MWQRVQTIFLSLVILCLVASIFFPIWAFAQGTEIAHKLYPLHYSTIEDGEFTTHYFPYAVTAILSIAAATLAFIQIGKYKNRMLQMKMGALNSLLLVGVIGSSVYLASQLVNQFQGGTYGFGLYLPGAAVIFNLIANRFIRKDEKLVRDSDRIR